MNAYRVVADFFFLYYIIHEKVAGDEKTEKSNDVLRCEVFVFAWKVERVFVIQFLEKMFDRVFDFAIAVFIWLKSPNMRSNYSPLSDVCVYT